MKPRRYLVLSTTLFALSSSFVGQAISANDVSLAPQGDLLDKELVVIDDFISMDEEKFRLNLPNLVVTDINPRLRGGDVVLEAWIKNDGPRDAGSFNVEAQVVNNSTGQVDQLNAQWPALPAGTSLRRELGLTTIVGQGDFFNATVDADVSQFGSWYGDVWESDESDNQRREGFMRLEQPTGHIDGGGHLP